MGDDTLTGNAEANRLNGGGDGDGSPTGGDDTISGGGGDDRLLGGNGYLDGADTLDGGAGQDTISAQDGTVDTVDCGTEIDVATTDADEGLTDTVTNCEFVNAASFSQPAPAGGTVNSDGQGEDDPGVSESDPVDIAVTTPNGGNVTVVEAEAVQGPQTAPDGQQFLALQVNITAPDATEADPLTLVFTIDSSFVPAGGAGAIKVFRDGTELDAVVPDADHRIGQRLHPQHVDRRRHRRRDAHHPHRPRQRVELRGAGDRLDSCGRDAGTDHHAPARRPRPRRRPRRRRRRSRSRRQPTRSVRS